MKLNWKPVNPDSRLPGYLQNHTKENAIWQLKLTAVFIAGMWIYDYVQTKREDKARARRLRSIPTPVE
jgi:hypothetical protein